MENLKRHKWIIHWTAFAALVGLFAFVAIRFEDSPWVSNVLQTVGTIAGIYLTIIIFFKTKEESDKQFREHLEHMIQLNTKQIEALQHSTDKQISVLQESTEKQIEALHKTTFEQISSFEKQISEVTAKLSDNSILLAEILGRELEKSIDTYSGTIQREKARYDNLSEWKFLRTRQEKEQQ